MDTNNNHCCYREQIGYALYAKFREPKLYRMANTGDWDRIPHRCRTHPKEASFIHKYPPSDTPLHRIVRPILPTTTTSSSSVVLSCGNSSTTTTASATSTNGTSMSDVNNTSHMEDESETAQQLTLDEQTLDQMNTMQIAAVVALISVHPDALLVRDAFGRTPLHWACMNMNEKYYSQNLSMSKKEDIVTIIIRACPEAVSVLDTERRTPLHVMVARCQHQIPIHLLSFFIEIDPTILSIPDVVNETPIQILQRRQDEIINSVEAMEVLKTGQQKGNATTATLAVN